MTMAKTAAQPPKHKRFVLNIVGAIEDRPRQLRAYGKACGGEFALVMRPRERSAVLVHLTKTEGHVWKSGEIPPVSEGHVRARAQVSRRGDQPRLVVAEGPYAGTAFLSYDPVPSSLLEGSTTLVEFSPNDQFAHLVAQVAGDSPLLPFAPISGKEAVALVKQSQKEVPEAGPTTLRGRWSGHLYCDDAKPVLRISRKLAAYGTLEIASHLGDGWSWAFHRDGKWFASEGTERGEGYAFLEEAIEAGILGAMKLVREACSFRDTRRRAAIDTTYGQQHPIQTPRLPANPVDKLKEPAPPKEKAPRKPRAPKVPEPVQDGTPLPPTPRTLPELARAADETAREADALLKLSALPWVHQDAADPDELAEWFEDNGFYDQGTAIREYIADPTRPLGDVLSEIEAGVRRHMTEDLGMPEEEQEDALAQVARLRTALESTPVLLERARKLIRYATAMVKSPACRGAEQAEAADAVTRATQIFEASREALYRGADEDARRQARIAAERVALSAAKVARSCAQGQQSVTSRIPSAPSRPAPTPTSGPRDELVVVPLHGRPASVDDLLARTTGHIATFKEAPTAANAKKWVKSALGAFGIQAVNIAAKTVNFPDIGGQRVFVTVTLPEILENDQDADQALAMVATAAKAKKGLGFSIEEFRYGAAAKAAPKGKSGRPPLRDTPEGSVPPDAFVFDVPAGTPRAPAPAPAAAPDVDPAKDKALLDAFSAAIAQAMGGGAA
jgi:hypothetical protein